MRIFPQVENVFWDCKNLINIRIILQDILETY